MLQFKSTFSKYQNGKGFERFKHVNSSIEKCNLKKITFLKRYENP